MSLASQTDAWVCSIPHAFMLTSCLTRTRHALCDVYPCSPHTNILCVTCAQGNLPAPPTPPARTPSAHDNDWTTASAQNVEAEDLSVTVLKRGGRVTINNMPYERQGAIDDRDTPGSLAVTSSQPAGTTARVLGRRGGTSATY